MVIGGVMQKIFYFVMVLLAYAALMLVTMAPHVDTSHCDQFEGAPKAACIAAAESGPPMTGDHTGMTGDHTGMTGDHTGMTGDHDRPPIDPRTGQPFSPADEATYQTYIEECEASGGTISAASMAVLIVPPHNFTRLQVERLCSDG